MKRKVEKTVLLVSLLSIIGTIGNAQVRMLSDVTHRQERANYFKSDEMGHILESGVLEMDTISIKHLEMLAVSPVWDQDGRIARNSWYYHLDSSRNAMYSKGKITNAVHFQGNVHVNNYFSKDSKNLVRENRNCILQLRLSD